MTIATPAAGSLNPSGRGAHLTPAELGEHLAVPVTTLSQWRVRHAGPPYVKIGGHVRYPRKELAAWLAAQLRNA